MNIAQASPIHRATLLLGFGRFGLEVLHRFLASTATRGVLVWEDAPGADKNARRLRDLGLLWVPDTAADATDDALRSQEGSQVELLRDLYQQITAVEAGGDGKALEDAMELKAKLLLDAATRSVRGENLPLGLDVIVLAQPAESAIIGRLTRLLEAGMDRLDRYAIQLRRPVSGASALNFIQILDFENFGLDTPKARHLRESTQRAVERWEQRRGEGKPGFGRIYLVDGLTAEGRRDGRVRIDEISLFLEFLLFEGQRGGELQSLYQPLALQEPLLSTFGIRLLERSGGLLRRLAAAYFGMQWLEHLAETGQPLQAKSSVLALREKLMAYRLAALEPLLGDQAVHSDLARQLEALAQEWLAAPFADPSWASQAQTRYGQAVARLENEWAARAHGQIQQILGGEALADLPETLRQAIGTGLHEGSQPATLGEVIRELEAVMADLADTRESQAQALAPSSLPGGLESLKQDHGRYVRFKQDQLRPGHAHGLWPLLALLLGLGLSPGLLEALSMPPPDPASSPYLWVRGYPIVHWLSEHPATLALGLGLVFWLPLAGLAQRAIAGRVGRARRYWEEVERGRLTGRVRALLSPEGDLGRPLLEFIARLRKDGIASLRSEVGRELGLALRRLRERRREMVWLHEQLREFLVMHGLNPDQPSPAWTRMNHERTGIRHTLENYEDFQRILHTNPPSPERFVSLQGQRQVFKHWEDRYCDAFLYPLRFIDELSEVFKDPAEEAQARPAGAQARELEAFLLRHGGFAQAFAWRAQEGVPADRVYCLLPRGWLGLPGIPSALAGLGINESRQLVGEDGARGYVLRVKTGVESACLSR